MQEEKEVEASFGDKDKTYGDVKGDVTGVVIDEKDLTIEPNPPAPKDDENKGYFQRLRKYIKGLLERTKDFVQRKTCCTSLSLVVIAFVILFGLVIALFVQVSNLQSYIREKVPIISNEGKTIFANGSSITKTSTYPVTALHTLTPNTWQLSFWTPDEGAWTNLGGISKELKIEQRSVLTVNIVAHYGSDDGRHDYFLLLASFINGAKINNLDYGNAYGYSIPQSWLPFSVTQTTILEPGSYVYTLRGITGGGRRFRINGLCATLLVTIAY